MVWATVVSSVVGAVAAKKASDKAGKRADVAQDQAKTVEQQQLDLANKQDARSEELFQNYRENFMPHEKALVDEAFGNTLSPARAEARATTDVRDSFAAARDIAGRNQRRLGVNPASGDTQALDRASMIDEARVGAGARTSAREGVRDRNYARQVDALSIGRGLPATASSMLGSAQQGTASAAALASNEAIRAETLAGATGSDFGESLANVGESLAGYFKSRKKPSQGEITHSTASGGY